MQLLYNHSSMPNLMDLHLSTLLDQLLPSQSLLRQNQFKHGLNVIITFRMLSGKESNDVCSSMPILFAVISLNRRSYSVWVLEALSQNSQLILSSHREMHRLLLYRSNILNRGSIIGRVQGQCNGLTRWEKPYISKSIISSPNRSFVRSNGIESL